MYFLCEFFGAVDYGGCVFFEDEVECSAGDVSECGEGASFHVVFEGEFFPALVCEDDGDDETWYPWVVPEEADDVVECFAGVACCVLVWG